MSEMPTAHALSSSGDNSKDAVSSFIIVIICPVLDITLSFPLTLEVIVDSQKSYVSPGT